MLAFAAGVMLAISFLELIPQSIELSSQVIAVIGVLAGAIVMWLVDKIIHHIHPEFLTQEQDHNLKKTALYLIAGIFIHNFPEGMAIATGAVSNLKVSIVIALAIAIHNIPEGICTSAPYYMTSNKRWKSFLISSSTAIPILVGFFIAYFLYQFIPPSFVGFLIGAVAGLMIYITADEIIPNCCGPQIKHSTIFALILGVLLVMFLGFI